MKIFHPLIPSERQSASYSYWPRGQVPQALRHKVILNLQAGSPTGFKNLTGLISKQPRYSHGAGLFAYPLILHKSLTGCTVGESKFEKIDTTGQVGQLNPLRTGCGHSIRAYHLTSRVDDT